MEEIKFGEQPEIEEQVQSDCDCGTSKSSSDGSLGKFKDAESLLVAYNNLQAEFTKKCQRLSELENSKNKVVYDDENWSKQVASFLEKNPEAKKFSKEISEYILRNPELKSNEKVLELAWSNIAMQNYKEPEKLIGDENFLNNFVFNNDNIKKQILENYLKQVKISPVVISGSDGVMPSSKEVYRPSNLKDAKKIVEKYFK